MRGKKQYLVDQKSQRLNEKGFNWCRSLREAALVRSHDLFRQTLPAIWLMTVLSLFASSRSEAQSIPLTPGNITSITSVHCPAGFIAGSSCQHLIVHGCANAIDLGVTIGTIAPALPKSTIVLFTGSNGTRPTGGAFATDYLKAGYRIVDTDWDAKPANGWEDTGVSSGEPASLLAGACRPAALLNYLEQMYPTTPFCAQGSSAGSSAIAYAISDYGVKPPDAVEFIPGPVMTKVDLGCNSSTPTVLVNPPDGTRANRALLRLRISR
jgi:hypothetical protein